MPQPTIPSRKCRICGKVFYKTKAISKDLWRRYWKSCSRSCAKLGTRRPDSVKRKIARTLMGLSRRDWHRMKRTRFYNIWSDMKKRCFNLKHPSSKNYGMRGITVCKEWLWFEGFRDDMLSSYFEHVEKFGEQQTLIERIDNNGNYSPDNCRWATRMEQGLNRRNAHIITYKGKTFHAAEWARRLNLDVRLISARRKKRPEDAAYILRRDD